MFFGLEARLAAIDLDLQRCFLFGRRRVDLIFEDRNLLLQLALGLLRVLDVLVNSLAERLTLEDDVQHRIHRADVGAPQHGHDQRTAMMPPMVQR